MDKKLYCVKAVLYVMAENEAEACVAVSQARFYVFESEAREVEAVDPEWNDAIPLFAGHKRTYSDDWQKK